MTATISRELAVLGRYIAWSPDGKVLACTGSGPLTLWEASTDKVRTIDGGGLTVSWSPDSKVIACGTELWDCQSGQKRGMLITLERGHWLAVSPEGNYRGSPGIEQELQVVVQTDKGQDTLTVEQFEKLYGWKNDPQKVRFLGE
jgi:WD40 repeat protein